MLVLVMISYTRRRAAPSTHPQFSPIYFKAYLQSHTSHFYQHLCSHVLSLGAPVRYVSYMLYARVQFLPTLLSCPTDRRNVRPSLHSARNYAASRLGFLRFYTLLVLYVLAACVFLHAVISDRNKVALSCRVAGSLHSASHLQYKQFLLWLPLVAYDPYAPLQKQSTAFFTPPSHPSILAQRQSTGFVCIEDALRCSSPGPQGWLTCQKASLNLSNGDLAFVGRTS
ncbi:hypothetical protein R3P38DRAFT_1857318 [Favolaschia claudopus]|uniref:Uncharacterized protein n=1 Tax=Favolaschia claudopus TaxID=2862362 RepID=A0AAW0D9K1_9AGAR